jgi:hypothetical protein
MATEVVEVVYSIEEPYYWAVEKMEFEKVELDKEFGLVAAGIGDRLKVVGMAANKPADMFDYHGHNLSNLEQIGLMEETKFAKAWVHSMNSEQESDNLY